MYHDIRIFYILKYQLGMCYLKQKLYSIAQIGYITQYKELRTGWVLSEIGWWLLSEIFQRRNLLSEKGLLCYYIATSELYCLEDLPTSLCFQFIEGATSYLVRHLFFAWQGCPCSKLEVTPPTLTGLCSLNIALDRLFIVVPRVSQFPERYLWNPGMYLPVLSFPVLSLQKKWVLLGSAGIFFIFISDRMCLSPWSGCLPFNLVFFYHS